MNDLEQDLSEIQRDLQKSEREQRLLEGDDGPPRYRFTRADAIDALLDGGTSGDLPKRDVVKIMRRNQLSS